MQRSLSISKEERTELIEKLLVYKIGVEKQQFSILLEGDYKPLEKPLTSMLGKDLVKIENDSHFVLAQKGEYLLKEFQEQYSNYLHYYDVFCAVDLERGEFAFASYNNFDDEKQWSAFIASPRFSDLRIAVAEYKGENISEILFLFLLNDGYFSEEKQNSGWPFELVLGSFWEEMENIYKKSIDYRDLGYMDDNGEEISSEDVLDDIIYQGEELLKEIRN